ncbi:MAG: hypothetical protein Q9213_008376 [Squamulea squamosa]
MKKYLKRTAGELQRLLKALDLEERPPITAYDNLTPEQEAAVARVVDTMSDTQKAALEHIKTSKHTAVLHQGPSGTGNHGDSNRGIKEQDSDYVEQEADRDLNQRKHEYDPVDQSTQYTIYAQSPPTLTSPQRQPITIEHEAGQKRCATIVAKTQSSEAHGMSKEGNPFRNQFIHCRLQHATLSPNLDLFHHKANAARKDLNAYHIFKDGGATHFYQMTRENSLLPVYSHRAEMAYYIAKYSPKLRFLARLAYDICRFGEEGRVWRRSIKPRENSP